MLHFPAVTFPGTRTGRVTPLDQGPRFVECYDRTKLRFSEYSLVSASFQKFPSKRNVIRYKSNRWLNRGVVESETNPHSVDYSWWNRNTFFQPWKTQSEHLSFGERPTMCELGEDLSWAQKLAGKCDGRVQQPLHWSRSCSSRSVSQLSWPPGWRNKIRMVATSACTSLCLTVLLPESQSRRSLRVLAGCRRTLCRHIRERMRGAEALDSVARRNERGARHF